MTGQLDIEARQVADDRRAELWGRVFELATLVKSQCPVERRPWIAEVLEEMFIEEDRLCALCGQPMTRAEFEVDHKILFRYGGGNERANIQLAQALCNRLKVRTSTEARTRCCGISKIAG